MKVHIEDDDQNEEGIKIYAGKTSIITVWDAESPDTEMEIVERIVKALREEEK